MSVTGMLKVHVGGSADPGGMFGLVARVICWRYRNFSEKYQQKLPSLPSRNLGDNENKVSAKEGNAIPCNSM